jgi:hypothetical protein
MTLDEALELLPEGADWRRLTPTSMSVYAANPYNSTAQVRYDGYGDTPAHQLYDAIRKMELAQAKKAQAIEARRAETTGSVEDESAVPEGNAPND